MNYWWVNQNQTFQQETEGGYLWSPKRNAHGGRNPFYEFMREVAPGDLVFSFQGTYIRAIGVARSTAYEAPKPREFGAAGPNWSHIGWRVDVHFYPLSRQIRPADHMHLLRRVLPERYSPLQASGRGNQGVYLTAVRDNLARVLVELIGTEAHHLVASVRSGLLVENEAGTRDVAVGQVEWEEHLSAQIRNDESVPETEREAIIVARRGQGKFKEAVMQQERRCRITGVDRIEHLRASHIKPWRDCEDHRQRLDGSNGLLLTPSIDHLFDRGFISFENNGELLVSPVAHSQSLQRMGIDTTRVVNVGQFGDDQRAYMEFHRDQVFLQAKVAR
ncbi:HNH endonuclease [Elongatibacter sediminis]|uniref:HNH endonuclease n=1 Tax=Elongatibacter sediminis TaxID=3119006 RepID=A0AAW9R9X2_9GAMM